MSRIWRKWRILGRRYWRRHRRLLLTLLLASAFFSLLGYCTGPGDPSDMCLIYG
ncbi:MAG: hypothetical protein RBR77_11800 [Thauera sp.]|nr:hypothetical protein [Thauera sp.]